VYEVDDGHPKLEAMVSTATWAATAERSAGYISVEINESIIRAPFFFGLHKHYAR
jgi:hypothetical protein